MITRNGYNEYRRVTFIVTFEKKNIEPNEWNNTHHNIYEQSKQYVLFFSELYNFERNDLPLNFYMPLYERHNIQFSFSCHVLC